MFDLGGKISILDYFIFVYLIYVCVCA